IYKSAPTPGGEGRGCRVTPWSPGRAALRPAPAKWAAFVFFAALAPLTGIAGSKSEDAPLPFPEPLWSRGVPAAPVGSATGVTAPRRSPAPGPPEAAADDEGRDAWSRQAFGFLVREEYRFSRSQDGSWSAPNRAHDLRTTLASGTVELTARIEGAEVSAG